MAAAPQTGAGMTVTVTGASGYVGAHLVKQLAERGYTVKATVRNADDEAKYGWVKRLADGTPGSVELFSADLLQPGSFDKAVEGSEVVHHVATVVAFNVKDPKKDVVDPAVEGTKNVLESVLKAKTVKRVVLTSSTAAVSEDFGPKGKTYSEEDWHRECSLKNAYPMAKTLAEKHAWKVWEEQKGKEGAFNLVTINPVMILGEVLHASQAKTSVQIVLQLMDGSLPMAPDFYWSIVHVRDVALAHILAAEKPEAQGRYIVSNDGCLSMLDMAKVIRSEYPHSKAPTLVMPNLLLYAVALVNPMLTVEATRRMLGRVAYFSSAKAKRELGISFIPEKESILDTARSLFEFGLLPKPERPPPRAFPLLNLPSLKKGGAQAPSEGQADVGPERTNKEPNGPQENSDEEPVVGEVLKADRAQEPQ